jgi:hypothetical protein
MRRLDRFGVALAAATLPRRVRDRYREEWLADLAGAADAGVRPSGIVVGALLFSVTLGRAAPEITGVPLGVTVRRRARWGVAFLGASAVLGFGGYILGGGPAALAFAAPVSVAVATVFVTLGVAQLWRAALHASALAVITAALATAAVCCLVAEVLLGGRGSLFLGGGFALLVAAGVCGAIVSSSAPPVPVYRTPQPWKPVGTTVAVATVALLALLALGAVDLLVWSPLAQTEGLRLDEIYAGLSDWDRSYGIFHIILWLAFWFAAVVTFAIVGATTGRRRGVSRLTVGTIALGLAASIVFFQFWAGFSLGMSIADTLPPYRGGISAFGYLYTLVGQLSLIGAIFLGIAPRRIAGIAGQAPLRQR